MDSLGEKDENENVLEQALRTYEQSERSLKNICNSVEQENKDFDDLINKLELHKRTLIKQQFLLKQQIEQIRQEHSTLTNQQNIFDQQTNHIQQRYEQVQLALKNILCYSLLANEHISQQTFSTLGFKLIPIDNEKPLTNHIGTNYDPPTSSFKRKTTSNSHSEKYQKNNHSHRSSK